MKEIPPKLMAELISDLSDADFGYGDPDIPLVHPPAHWHLYARHPIYAAQMSGRWQELAREVLAEKFAVADADTRPGGYADLQRMADEPPPMVGYREDGQPLFYRYAYNLLYGPPGSGKSWAAMLAVKQIVTGPVPQRCVYLDYEDNARNFRRRMDLLGLDDPSLRRVWYKADPGKLSERIQDPDEAWLREPIFSGDNPAIIVIDGVESFASAHGYDTNSNSDWANLVREALAPLYQTGAAVVLVDHVVKNRQTSGDYPIGAVQKKGLCRGAAYSVDAKNGVTRLVMRKDTHGQLGAGKGDHVAAVSGDYSASSTFLIPAAESKAAPTDYAARVRAFLRSHDGATAREIRDNVTGDNKAIAQVIEAMTQQGEIHPVKDGRKMRHHLVSP
jgi:hypothetical protein